MQQGQIFTTVNQWEEAVRYDSHELQQLHLREVPVMETILEVIRRSHNLRIRSVSGYLRERTPGKSRSLALNIDDGA